MGIEKPTGDYAEEMLGSDGWPDVEEDTYYDRSQEYTQVLRQVTLVLETCQSQQGEIFEGGLWSGGAAGAANGELGTNIDELTTLQNGLATVITWQKYIYASIRQAKSDVTDNVEGAHRQINVLENDSSLDSDERTTAINTVVKATHGANVSLVAGAAEQIRASKAWKPPGNALKELLDQKIPPPVTIPDTPPPAPRPGESEDERPTPVQPVIPSPVVPVRPPQPEPVAPVPVPGVLPQPTPVTPAVEPVSPTPFPGGGSSPIVPGGGSSPIVPGGGSSPTVPSVPGVPGGGAPAPVRPAAATQPSDAGKGMTPASTPAAVMPVGAGMSEESSPGVAPAGGAGMPAAPMAPGGSSGGAGKGSAAPGGAAPAGKAAPSTRPAAASSRPAARSGPAARAKATDHTESVDATPVASIIPVSPTLAARDAIADASTADAARRKSGGTDPLRLARRIAAALNAPGNGGQSDFGFFWVTGVTTDGEIVVANSYGLAYIPDGVQLPEKVHMASADKAISAAERARWATYPVMAVRGWAEHHNAKLRAVIGTEEQLANSDPGVTKVVLQPEDIPESGDMVGRSRLEVVDPETADRLASTTDMRLVALMPPAPANAQPAADALPEPAAMDPEEAAKLAANLTAGALDLQELIDMLPAQAASAQPTDQRPMLWFEVMKPMTSGAAGRQAAHLKAFHTYAAASEEAVLAEAQTAVDPVAQRTAVGEWLYWKHLTGLLSAALAGAS
jgi:hypothetical protein